MNGITLYMDKEAAREFVDDKQQCPGSYEIRQQLQYALKNGIERGLALIPTTNAVLFIEHVDNMEEDDPRREVFMPVRGALLRCGRNLTVFHVYPEGLGNPVCCVSRKEALSVAHGLLSDAPDCEAVVIEPDTMDLEDLVEMGEHAGW